MLVLHSASNRPYLPVCTQHVVLQTREMTAVAAGHGWRGNPVHAVSSVKLRFGYLSIPLSCPRILLHTYCSSVVN